jgi:hypothetical protein
MATATATKNAALANFAPFFTATVLFKNDKAPAGAYDCVACGNDIGDKNTPAAISYATNYLGSWAHPACLMKAKIVMTDDKRLKKAAQAVHRDAFQASYQNRAKTTTTVSSTPAKTTVTKYTAPTPAPTPPANMALTYSAPSEADLRATIEAEYEARLTAMVNIILAKNERIATLESDNEKLAMELSKIMVTSVAPTTPAPTTTHNQKLVQEIKAMGRCGAPKKDGTACRWDTRKTACMHHNRVA